MPTCNVANFLHMMNYNVDHVSFIMCKYIHVRYEVILCSSLNSDLYICLGKEPMNLSAHLTRDKLLEILPDMHSDIVVSQYVT